MKNKIEIEKIAGIIIDGVLTVSFKLAKRKGAKF
jgi:hypothetical protein